MKPRLSRPVLSRALVVSFAFSTLASGGCATAPKPPELLAYETLRRDPGVPDASKRAPDLVSASEKLGAKATEEWSSNDLEESRRDALQAQIRLKTALALLDQERSKARLQALTADQAKADDELAQVTQELSAVKVQADLAKKLVDTRKAADQEKEQLAKQLAADQQKLKQASELLAVQEKMANARLALRTADTVDAKKYAEADYSAAEDLMHKADEELKAGNLASANASLEVARGHAEKAVATARPLYEQASQAAENRQRDEALQRDAQAIAGVDVRIDARGALRRLVLSVGGLFGKGATSKPLDTRLTVLDPVAALINKYPTYPVQVIGHTDNKGKVGELMALSQSRAQSIFDALVSRGVDAKRLMVSGQGPNEPLTSNRSATDRAKNNRVEIVFLYH